MIDYALRPADLVFTIDDVERLPLDTKVEMQGYTFRKNEEGWYHESHRNQLTMLSPVEYETAIIKMPDPAPESLERFQWRVFTIGITAGKRYSVQGVPETMKRLGLDAQRFPVGVGMRLLPSDIDSTYLLPVGSLISYGTPDEGMNFALYRRDPDGWVRVFGPRNHHRHGWATVEEIGGVGVRQRWLEAEPDDTSAIAIAKWKAEAWREGNAARGRYSWCGTFLTVMNRLNIDAEAELKASTVVLDAVAAGTSPLGMHYTNEQIARFPVGTLFEFYGDRSGHRHWIKRDDDVAYMSGRGSRTVRVAAWDAEGHHVDSRSHGSRRGAVLLGGPGSRVPLPSPTWTHWEGLPVGTRFVLDSAESPNEYEKGSRRRFGRITRSLDRHHVNTIADRAVYVVVR